LGKAIFAAPNAGKLRHKLPLGRVAELVVLFERLCETLWLEIFCCVLVNEVLPLLCAMIALAVLMLEDACSTAPCQLLDQAVT